MRSHDITPNRVISALSGFLTPHSGSFVWICKKGKLPSPIATQNRLTTSNYNLYYLHFQKVRFFVGVFAQCGHIPLLVEHPRWDRCCRRCLGSEEYPLVLWPPTPPTHPATGWTTPCMCARSIPPHTSYLIHSGRRLADHFHPGWGSRTPARVVCYIST